MIADIAYGTGPVVTSYSVTEGFPNMGVAAHKGVWSHPGMMKDEHGEWVDDGAALDVWDKLSAKDQFEIGLRYVHKDAHLTPGNLREGWNSGASAFDIRTPK